MPRYDGHNFDTDRPIPHVNLEQQMDRLACLPESGPCVYILCTDHEIGGVGPKSKAGHYLGSTCDIRTRAVQHVSGNGAKVVKAFNADGVLYSVHVHEMDSESEAREVESYIKKVYKKTPNLCPCCGKNVVKKMDKIRSAVRERARSVEIEYTDYYYGGLEN